MRLQFPSLFFHSLAWGYHLCSTICFYHDVLTAGLKILEATGQGLNPLWSKITFSSLLIDYPSIYHSNRKLTNIDILFQGDSIRSLGLKKWRLAFREVAVEIYQNETKDCKSSYYQAVVNDLCLPGEPRVCGSWNHSAVPCRGLDSLPVLLIDHHEWMSAIEFDVLESLWWGLVFKTPEQTVLWLLILRNPAVTLCVMMRTVSEQKEHLYNKR